MTESVNTVNLEGTTEQAHFGYRLDQVLADLFPEYSRSKLKSWIVDGNVRLNGEVVTAPRHKILGDEHVTVQAQMEVQITSQPQQIDLDIVYEDDDILIINKPANLVVHPGAGNKDGTVLNALLAHVPNIDTVPRAGIVHRLDKDTTGLMVVAKTVPAQTHLVDQLQRRVMSREYEALAIGTMVAGGVVEAPIGRHATKRTHMAVREFGKPAVTHYRVIEKFRAHTHLRLKLETGRTHQIRVHMAHIKHPLVGDPGYGGRARLPKGASPELVDHLRGFNRQALHAAQLSLNHPTTGEWMTWQAPLPEDMVALIDAVREDTLANPDAAL
ncbi:23S rRNA pseudouridine(1911/1915/1917) synthase RluD [Alteromonas sp. ASW11-19]|uniref:Pseudouridine synthase n=1 Tax=Alteromonas salexigens TaxID=2982530 RepID=A0ABT2VR46_9ALTE|nr:23S rRNA pseudouridine(1911/1915/1917) synthase RluD [Alteromonas salexigens]MCU7555781.1 23S rRNA pseudouridine(1911/1915/1917) synthase RluD [Alteromonas salexigens]